MNKSLIWIATGVAGIGFAIPAYAAMSSQSNGPVTTPSPTVVSLPEVARGDDAVVTVPSTPPVISIAVKTPAAAPVSTPNSIDDHGLDDNGVDDRGTSGTCDAHDANDDRCTGVDDSNSANPTVNSVEDISGPCDEPEHATDDRCTGAVTSASIDDNSGHDAARHGGTDDTNHSGHGGGNDG